MNVEVEKVKLLFDLVKGRFDQGRLRKRKVGGEGGEVGYKEI